ncbi:MAG TPA: alginate lyase family protein [Roseiflexaceae bacterium]|nr:alginate lyase family protein [Roseiflexaceae bacterium]
MPRPRRFMRTLAVGLMAIVICTILGIPQASRVTHVTAANTAELSHLMYLPVTMRPLVPTGIVTTPSQLVLTKTQADTGAEPSRAAVKSLLQNAGEALLSMPCAVASYTTSVGGNCLNQASESALVLALAYWMTGDPRYSSKAADFIRAWSNTLIQIDLADDQAQLDWSRFAPALIWGAELLDGAPGWTLADRQKLTAMLVSVVLPQGQLAAKRSNNWADAGNLLRLSIAVYANLSAERKAAIADWKIMLDGVRQADGSWRYGMLPDGSLAEEDRRGASGLSYNQGALSLKTVFAEIVRRQGDDSLYSYRTSRGVGLKNGWDFLAAQVVNANSGICTWPYTPDHCVDYSNRSGWEIAYAYWREPAYLGPLSLHRPYQWSNWADPGYSTVMFSTLNINGK